MKAYPSDARERKEAGVVQVFFSLNRKGELVSSRIVKSSGSPSLDNAALEIIRRGQPFAPPPIYIEGEKIDLTVPIRFNWRDLSLPITPEGKLPD
jgi:protein TonB